MSQNAEALNIPAYPAETLPQPQTPVPVVEAIITSVKGSAPTQVGDSMILLSNGRWIGSVGGGNLEWKLMQAGQLIDWRYRENGKLPTAATMKIDHGLGCHTDQCCGGRVEAHLVFIPENLAPLMNEQSQRHYQFDAEQRLQLVGGISASGEPLGESVAPDSNSTEDRLQWTSSDSLLRTARKAPQLWIFGAGHIARELAPLAAKLNYRVSVFDGRAQWADPDAFPAEINIRQSALPEASDQADADTIVLIMTHSHKLDYQLLALMSEWPLAYLGVIGSRTKSVRFRHRLDDEGIDDSHIHMPIGLPDMGKEPMAVAVSCMAELLQIRERQKQEAAA